MDVLLLEDNDVDAAVFVGAASRYAQPLAVRRASSLSDFRLAMEERWPDVICADHMLPDGVATDALKACHGIAKHIPFLVITGAGEEDVAVDYMRLGASDYLSKRRLSEFGLVLDIVLQGYRHRAARHRAPPPVPRQPSWCNLPGASRAPRRSCCGRRPHRGRVESPPGASRQTY